MGWSKVWNSTLKAFTHLDKNSDSNKEIVTKLAIYIKKEELTITIWTFHYFIPRTPYMVRVIVLDKKNRFQFLAILNLYISNLHAKLKFKSSFLN